MASVLLGSGDMPSLSMMCPRYSILDWWNLHFALLRVSPSFCIRLRTSCSLWSCTSLVAANIKMSSTWTRTPGMSARSSFIFRWKCSGALLMPKGSLLKQNRPIGVRNVVRSLDSSDSGTCQKPLFVSNLVNTLAPAIWARVESTLGSGCTSLITFSFNGFRSTHTRSFPDGLVTMTIPAHHGVGSLTLEITPSFCIRCSSFSTSARCGSATRRGTYMANGVASGFRRIV